LLEFDLLEPWSGFEECTGASGTQERCDHTDYTPTSLTNASGTSMRSSWRSWDERL